MKSKTIWESASRPLFVRSVWLESNHEGRGVQHRHFLLDYESQKYMQQRRQPSRSAALSPVRSWRQRDDLRHSVSCDFSELSASNESQLTTTENLLQIGSAKIKLQQPINQQTRQQFKLLKFHRRPSLTKQIRRQHHTNDYDCSLNWRMRCDLQEIYSRHSSLQDLQSTLSMACLNPEERLAERVLNWLDLAGKSGLVKSPEEDETQLEMLENENIPQNCERRLQQRQRTQQQQHAQHPHHQQQQHKRQKMLPRQQLQGGMFTKKRTRNPLHRHYSEPNPQQSKSTRHQRDAVKPITIIFNRDGYPVRLNRAARNIDLCTLASSAGTTRRLAGTLASARLYHGNEAISYKPLVNGASSQQQPTARSSSTARQRNGFETEKSAAQTSQKRLHDDYGGNQQTHDSKRQLHIFMPSLPKKGIVSSTSPSLLSTIGGGGGGDDSSVSLLSQRLNEACRL